MDWIPTNERMPEENKWILMIGRTSASHYHNHCWIGAWLGGEKDKWSILLGGILGKDNVTHWMPLPEPPD